MILTFRQEAISLEPHTFGLETELAYTLDRPIWVEHLRIYQRVPYAMTGDTWAVLRDAIIDGNQDAAGQILASDDVMPGWRRSSVFVEELRDYATNRILLHRVLAGVVWDIDLKKLLTRSEGFQLRLSNIDDAPITIRPYCTCRVIDDDELEQLSNWRR